MLATMKLAEVDAGQIGRDAAELDQAAGDDDRQHAEACNEMAGEERRQEHADDVHLDHGGAVDEVKPHASMASGVADMVIVITA